MSARLVPAGEWKGFPIRKARKDWSCDGWKHQRGHATIPAASFYIEGYMDPERAGGFGHDRLCLACVDDDAREAVRALSTEQVAA